MSSGLPSALGRLVEHAGSVEAVIADPDTTLIFDGLVQRFADPDDDDRARTVRIGGRDVLASIRRHWSGDQRLKMVTVAIAEQQPIEGYLHLDLGAREYSEVTPEEVGNLLVGPHNLKDVLNRHDGNNITMWIAGYPVNTMEPHELVRLAHPWRGHRPGDELILFRSDADELDRAGRIQRPRRTR